MADICYIGGMVPTDVDRLLREKNVDTGRKEGDVTSERT